ncbi:MAG: T9SS type A sorting domain-containing protein [Chlorobi bacterium]|nr:T9SS type A sorting domain-containing protein [Chlorobiota bacterium]
MKKTQVLFALLALMIVVQSRAQIEWENSYEGTVYQTKTAVKGDIYYSIDSYNNKCVLYNSDHSIWKTIDINIPEDNYIYEIKYVSQHLFNSDDLVELLVVYSEYKYTNDTIGYYEFTTMIVNETDGELLSVLGGANPYVFNNGGSSSKLMIYIYDYSLQLYPLQTQVYHLPGVQLAVNDLEDPGGFPLKNPFPNPSRSEITIPYNLSAGEESGYLVIADNTGKTIDKYFVGQKEDQLKINISSLKSGIYLYWIESPNRKSATRKFIVE